MGVRIVVVSSTSLRVKYIGYQGGIIIIAHVKVNGTDLKNQFTLASSVAL